ncbi:major facilitator superfamily domain-containing protein [Leucosporidium creatinivorum]|uniref:Major facilitator superfamily domain-containing protein n=1 Tax=Leucosporidium creatinivorum TaxID=106004 RepID=A0A1Y2G5M5_9BASI|nr:major facilitator superfamily domain-containing protein [Leucosporidium creatinivorum]
MSIEPIPLETATSRLQEDHAILHAADLESRTKEREPSVVEEQQQQQDAGFVEGSVRGWCAVAGAFLILLCTFGYANSFGVYQSYYQLNQYRHLSASTISWIGSTSLGIEFCFAFVSGPLFDRGYFRPLLITGSVGFVVCLFMTSLCTQYWQTFLAQAVGMGASMGLMFMPAISVLNHYFLARRSFVMGVAMSGASIGGIIFPIMLNHLFASIGFAAGVRASGYVVIAGFVAANILTTARYPPVKRDEQGMKRRRPSPVKLLKEPRYALSVIGTTAVVLGAFFPISYIQVFAEAAQLPRNVSDNVLSILNASSFFGRLGLTYAADSLGTFTVLATCTGGISVLIFALYGATSPAGVIIFAILFGFFTGSFFALLSPLLISTADDISEIGMRQGLALLLNGLAALVCSPIAGALLAAGHDDFKYAIAFAGAVTAFGAVTMLGARHFQARQLGTWRV